MPSSPRRDQVQLEHAVECCPDGPDAETIHWGKPPAVLSLKHIGHLDSMMQLPVSPNTEPLAAACPRKQPEDGTIRRVARVRVANNRRVAIVHPDIGLSLFN